MSQRLGMADGRCATINVSSRIFNDELFKKAGDNSFSHRMYLQRSAPQDVIPPSTCSLFEYPDANVVKDSAIIRESTNVISQLEDRD